MCGIAGVLYNDKSRTVEPRVVERMCEVIHHRGPDEWGMWSQGAIGLGMKRLQIIDLAGGHQPMSAAGGALQIVFNGEIYNFRDLRKILEGRGCHFESASDTETILHAYLEFGQECVQHLRGMFAFAIWDARNRSLFLARDRFGKKPLHYLHDDEKFVFGSEIKSILCHPEVVAEVHRPAVPKYLSYGYVPDPLTMFRGISKLPPGHTLFWREEKIQVTPYWDLQFKTETETRPDQHYLDRTDELLREAVRMRLVSDVPLGAFLSGGVDSSLVVAMMAMQMGEPVKTFSIGFDDEKFNELPYARLVAERYGTEHHEEIVKPDAEMILPEIIDNFDEPFADSSAIPTYYVSLLAKRHVTVALSGDGGDEIFGGYDRYRDSKLASRLDTIPQWFKGSLLAGVAEFFPEGKQGLNSLRYLAADADSRYAAKMSGGMPYRYKRVLSDELLEELQSEAPPGADVLAALHACGSLDKLTRRQYADIKNYLPGDILTKVDRTSMLASLETRAPLLDHKLAEFAATIPASVRGKDGELKHVLKDLARRYLPHELIDRPKMGFAVPISRWINREWKELSNDLVLSERAIGRGNLNPEHLRRLMDEHRNEKRDHSSKLWTLMVLEMWYRKYIDG